LTASALAQQAGTWSVAAGVTRISPSVTSDSLVSPPGVPTFPNAKVDVNSNAQVTGAVNYMATDHINIHVPLGLGFKHDVLGAGALAGVGKVAETKALPVTVLGQYRIFEANARFRPYVGAGLTYVRFYKERGSTLLTALTNPGGAPTGVSFESKLAPTIQLGAVYNIDDKWFVEGSYTKTRLKTRGTLTTGHTIDVRLDPSGLCLHLGYKF
ncbi:MAG: OmpW/AlkL family protein, partial [Polaromonas sp.]